MAEKDIQNLDRNMRERWRCAGALLLRGIIAPASRAYQYADKALQRHPNEVKRTEYVLRALHDPVTKYNVDNINGDVCYHLLRGLAAGFIILAESLVEAPFQLVRQNPPQSHPWLERHWKW